MPSILSETVSSALTQPAAGLFMAALLSLLIALCWYQGLKMRKLERQLANQHQYFRQELTMINQSAMGVGNRVKYLEQKFKRQPNAFEQVLAQAAQTQPAKPEDKPAKSLDALLTRKKDVPKAAAAPKQSSSRAEQALDRWMQDSRHIA